MSPCLPHDDSAVLLECSNSLATLHVRPIAKLTFTSLPIPFFAELAATLASRDLRRTLANLNQTATNVRAMTSAGLWKTCRLNETYDLGMVKDNSSLRLIIKEIWVVGKPPFDLRKAFPNATTIMYTVVNHQPIDLANYIDEESNELAINIIAYDAGCHFPVVHEMLHDRYQYLRIKIAADAQSAVKVAWGRQQVNERWRGGLKVHASSEEDAAALLDVLQWMAVTVKNLTLVVRVPRMKDWYSERGQALIFCRLTSFIHLEAYLWDVILTQNLDLNAPFAPRIDFVRGETEKLLEHCPQLLGLWHEFKRPGAHLFDQRVDEYIAEVWRDPDTKEVLLVNTRCMHGMGVFAF